MKNSSIPDNLNSVQVVSKNLFPVVGVGASAGGLQSFKILLKAIPENSGMAYILIQHLAPHHESILAELLQKATRIPVIEITDRIEVKPDHIYVIPSDKILIANDGILLLENRQHGEHPNTIDLFFISLAEIHQEHAIGIVLSGTGKDGTIGLKAIKDQGGITIVQNAETAAYKDMPQNAVDAEVVDFELAPDKMPGYLLDVLKISRTRPSNFLGEEELLDDELFKRILTLIRIKRGVDFTYYKQTTIRRRILRRKNINRFETLKDYHANLLENKEELDALFRDIVIPVTAFFRDPKVFETVCEIVFPELFKNRKPDDPIRIWIAGCSTGEEAYSLAICLHEYMDQKQLSVRIQIFATDIADHVITKARSGLYQKADLAGVSEERVNNYFTKINGAYQINKTIRSMCVFACQNFIKDPPFARIDLLSCRNVLIYMEPYLQKKALATFHFALNPSGFLLLGKSETVGNLSDHFKNGHPKEKLYVRKTVPSAYMPVASYKRETEMKQTDVVASSAPEPVYDIGKSADEVLLQKQNVAGVIVNDQLDIVDFRGSTSAYLKSQPGKASHNLLKMAVVGLSFELRVAVHNAKLTNEVVRKEGISIKKGKRLIAIEVIPLQKTPDPHFLILFEEQNQNEKQDGRKKKKRKKLKDANGQINGDDKERIAQLEKELVQVREDMRAITEDQDASSEELQTANEELLSGSEELQSLNEELETTKEEIQSTNEELSTLNQELLEINEQLINSRKYAEAIVGTMHDPLIILTKDMIVKSANKAYYEKHQVTPKEVEGKLFFTLENGKWNFAELKEKLQRIIPEKLSFERLEIKVFSENVPERIFRLNARQIDNENSKEQLILLAIQDITQQKNFEKELESQVSARTNEVVQKNKSLEQLNDNLLQFASIASHDLQEPLRKVRTFAELLKRDFSSELPAEAKEIIRKMHLSAERMTLLIKEVLHYSKVIHTKKEFISTDLDVILHNVLSDLDMLLAEKRAIVKYNNDLPVIDAIPLLMNQLFYNLLTNSIKFHQENSVPEISIRFEHVHTDKVKEYAGLRADRAYVQIVVMDRGIGFDQQFENQIFQLFERLQVNDIYEGTGVGLALCKKIVEIHNGHIFARSKENEGASFFIILPVNQ